MTRGSQARPGLQSSPPVPPLPFSFPGSGAGPSRAESTHLPLLLLPGRIQQQVPVPVVLLLHVGLRSAGRTLVIGSVIIDHVSKRKPECATEKLSGGEKLQEKTPNTETGWGKYKTRERGLVLSPLAAESGLLTEEYPACAVRKAPLLL